MCATSEHIPGGTTNKLRIGGCCRPLQGSFSSWRCMLTGRFVNIKHQASRLRTQPNADAGKFHTLLYGRMACSPSMRAWHSCCHAPCCSLLFRLLQLLLCDGHLQQVLQLLQLVQQLVARGMQAEVLRQLLMHTQHPCRCSWRSRLHGCNQQLHRSTTTATCPGTNNKEQLLGAAGSIGSPAEKASNEQDLRQSGGNRPKP